MEVIDLRYHFLTFKMRVKSWWSNDTFYHDNKAFSNRILSFVTLKD